ncbi:MAG: hypothetical protein ABI778_07300 [Ignavibacteriota bacterium]
MINIRLIILSSFLSLTLSGCATIFNGWTQNVPVDIPQEVSIVDSNGVILPIKRKIILSDTISYIELKRKQDHLLTFRLKDKEIKQLLTSSLDEWWIFPDLFYFFPLFIDIATGAWFRFEGIKVSVVNDSLKSGSSHPLLETYTPPHRVRRSIGGIFLARFGAIWPLAPGANPIFFNFGSIGIGYSILKPVELYVTFNGGGVINVLPESSSDYLSTSFISLLLESRYKVIGDLYLSGGGGMAHVFNDSLRSNTPQGYSTKYPPTSHYIPSLFIGIGVAGSTGFIELQHTFGLSKFPLANGEIGKFETTALNFGLNLHF